MRNFMWLAAGVICAAAVGLQWACKATDEIPGRTSAARAAATSEATPLAAPQHDASADVHRITTAELQEAMQKEEAVIVDVRGQEAYDAGHIKGSITQSELDKRLDNLPKDKLIITYCA